MKLQSFSKTSFSKRRSSCFSDKRIHSKDLELLLLLHLFLPYFIYTVNYAPTSKRNSLWFGYNFPQHNPDRLFASLLDVYMRINISEQNQNHGSAVALGTIANLKQKYLVIKKHHWTSKYIKATVQLQS